MRPWNRVIRRNPLAVDEPVRIGNWEPENYGQKYHGEVTLRTALALSLNSVAAKLANAVGPENVVAVAHRLGITSHLGTDASIALGTSEVTLLELTSAFTPFANGGYSVAPFAVLRITTRDGQVIYERNGDGLGQAITNRDLGSMNSMMRAVVTEGTAKKAQIANFDIAGKTGTSQDYRDAWFVGYSSYLVGGVWLGNDDNSPTKNVTGGSVPATIWKDVMEVAHANLSPAPLPGYLDEQPDSDDPTWCPRTTPWTIRATRSLRRRGERGDSLNACSAAMMSRLRKGGKSARRMAKTIPSTSA